MLLADASFKVNTFEKPGKEEYSVPMGTCITLWPALPPHRDPAISGMLPATQRPSGSRILVLKALTPLDSKILDPLGRCVAGNIPDIAGSRCGGSAGHSV